MESEALTRTPPNVVGADLCVGPLVDELADDPGRPAAQLAHRFADHIQGGGSAHVHHEWTLETGEELEDEGGDEAADAIELIEREEAAHGNDISALSIVAACHWVRTICRVQGRYRHTATAVCQA